jgi:hypothetical protein
LAATESNSAGYGGIAAVARLTGTTPVAASAAAPASVRLAAPRPRTATARVSLGYATANRASGAKAAGAARRCEDIVGHHDGNEPPGLVDGDEGPVASRVQVQGVECPKSVVPSGVAPGFCEIDEHGGYSPGGTLHLAIWFLYSNRHWPTLVERERRIPEGILELHRTARGLVSLFARPSEMTQ